MGYRRRTESLVSFAVIDGYQDIDGYVIRIDNINERRHRVALGGCKSF